MHPCLKALNNIYSTSRRCPLWASWLRTMRYYIWMTLSLPSRRGRALWTDWTFIGRFGAIVEVDDLGFWAMTLQRFDERATNCPCSSQSTCSQSPSRPSRQEGRRGPSLPHLRRAFLNGFIEWLEILHGNENLSSHLKVENLADKLDAHHIIQEIVEGDGMTLNSGSDTTMLQ